MLPEQEINFFIGLCPLVFPITYHSSRVTYRVYGTRPVGGHFPERKFSPP